MNIIDEFLFAFCVWFCFADKPRLCAETISDKTAAHGADRRLCLFLVNSIACAAHTFGRLETRNWTWYIFSVDLFIMAHRSKCSHVVISSVSAATSSDINRHAQKFPQKKAMWMGFEMLGLYRIVFVMKIIPKFSSWQFEATVRTNDRDIV